MTCDTDFNKQITHKEATLIIEEVKSYPLQPGEAWYLIQQSWWNGFCIQEQKDVDSFKYKAINNSDLVEQESSSNEDTPNQRNGFKLKSQLVESLDYTLMPEKIFKRLRETFGIADSSRDVIKRPVIIGSVLQKDPFVEIYPLRLKIAKYNRPDDVKFLEVSHSKSFVELKEAAFELLSVPSEQRKSSQILVEKSEGDFEAISDKQTNSLATILTLDTVFYVDDGSKNLRSSSSRAFDELNGNSGRRLGSTHNTSSSSERHMAGLCGLQNLGNTCFMNSALQCLSNCPELTEYFLSKRVQQDINPKNVLGTGGKLANAYKDLISEMWSGGCSYVRPYHFKCTIGQFAPRFNGYSQHDSQELMAFLLDGLHEDLNRIYVKPYVEEKESDGRSDHVVAEEAWLGYKKRNDSIIVDLMHGQRNVCSKTSIKFDPFCFLSVPVPSTRDRYAHSAVLSFDKTAQTSQPTKRQHYTLDECIEIFTKKEQLDRNEAWYCPACKEHQCAYKQLDVWKLPKILIVHLKRFLYTRFNREKIDTEIVIPTKNFSLTDKLANADHEQVTYDLVAISNHMGGLGSGHYSAKAHLKTLNKWCDFNDSCVSPANDLPEQLASREAYILIYRQREPNAANKPPRRSTKLSESESMEE